MRVSHYSRVDFFAAVAALTIAVASRSECQARPPQLRAIEDLRIDKPLSIPIRQAALVAGPTGQIIVAPLQAQGSISGFDSAGKPLPWKIRIGGRDAEINWVTRLGWSGSTLWVGDPSFGQIALVNLAGKVTKSLEYPAWIRPAWADRRKYPLFEHLEPFALYADGSWLVRPSRQKSVMSTPEYDETFDYLMRIGENGSIQKVVAKLIRDDGLVSMKWGGNKYIFSIPFFAKTRWDVSPDGSRIIFVSTSLRGPDSASYRVTMLAEKGDTIFSKKFPVTLVPVPRKAVDSAMARINRSVGERSPEQIRELVAKEVPPVYAPVENAIAGMDKTAWIELRSTDSGRPWMVLDANGATIGVVQLPKEFVARAADRNHVWGFDSDGDHVTALVRYKIVAGSAPSKR